MSKYKINGAKFLLRIPKVKQGVLQLKQDAKLDHVDYQIFVPKIVSYSYVFPNRKNNFNHANFKDNWLKAKVYAKELKSNHPLISKIIDLDTGKDKILWRGSPRSKKDFFLLSRNTIKPSKIKEDKKLYFVSYIDYSKDTKDVFTNFIKKNENGTVNEFINSSSYKSLVDFSKRNSKKFIFDIAVRMGLFVNKQLDTKAKVESGKPYSIGTEKIWMLNQFKRQNEELWCYHNLIPIQNKEEVIKINGKQIQLLFVEIGEKFSNKPLAYQIFNHNPGTINNLSLEEKNKNKVFFIGENKHLDLKPSEKYTSEVKHIKILVHELTL